MISKVQRGTKSPSELVFPLSIERGGYLPLRKEKNTKKGGRKEREISLFFFFRFFSSKKREKNLIYKKNI